jgi:uncharacterized protein YndB with AHSA1/START domain
MSDDLVLTRVLEAPRSLVWRVWTDPVHLARWWGPAGFVMKVARLDLRVGGLFHYAMTPPDSSSVLWGRFVYDEIVPSERLVFRNSFSDEAGGPARNPFSPTWPLEVHNTLILTEENAKTVLTLRSRPHNATEEETAAFQANKHNVSRGFDGTFAQLEAYLAEELVADRTLVSCRTLDAPRDRVWKAWTDPVEMQKWWGPVNFICPAARIDLRVGGSYLLGMRSPEGQEFWSTGTYQEIAAEEKLVYTDNFSDAEGNVVPASSLGLPGQWPELRLVTATFADLGEGKTLLTVHQESLPAEWNDMTVSGWSTSFDKLSLFLSEKRGK